MKTIVLILFVVDTGIHLYASLRKDKSLRNKTKPFILLFLLAYYCMSAESISVFVVLALLFSWLGDVLLIPDGVRWFTSGGIAFMISHFFFILTYAGSTDFTHIGRPILILLPAAFLIASVIIFRYIRPHLPEAIAYPTFLYLLINGTMNCFAWFRSVSTTGPAAVITAIGALLFYVSDTTLFSVRFNKDSRFKTHFPVMLTYSIGEFLIVLGLILK